MARDSRKIDAKMRDAVVSDYDMFLRKARFHPRIEAYSGQSALRSTSFTELLSDLETENGHNHS